jgi:NadR type nicotinamide-nucleotide adenylyltransferase
MALVKVAIIGPESTGKSTLCKQLARHYQTLWCPEYAREFLSAHGSKYNYEDLLTIAKGQVDLEEKYESGVGAQKLGVRTAQPVSKLLFIDTEMYVMKVWCEFVFGKCHQYILDKILDHQYDLYLLCNVDLLWVPDELREYPDLGTRKKLYKIYLDIMVNQNVPWTAISGNSEERLQKAIAAVEAILKK